MASPGATFLEGFPRRSIELAAFDRRADLLLGKGASPLEVVLAPSTSEPTAVAMRAAWKKRLDGRAAPLLLVVEHGERIALCGPAGEDPVPSFGVDRGQAERICREALEQPDRHSALRCLRDALPAVASELSG